MGTVGIQMTTQQVLVAPAPIWLEATNPTGFEDEVGSAISEPATDGDYDETFHKITYIWTAERETSPGVWTDLTGDYPRVQNMVTAWNQAFVAYGKRVAFRLPDPGTYRFQCWCVDMQGNTGLETSAAVTIKDPDTAFTAANTIIYAGDGNFSGAPAGDTQVSSMAALNTAIQGRSNPTRVRFKPGETVSGNLDITGDARAEYIDTWTPGQKVTRRSAMTSRFSEFVYTLHTAAPQVQTTWVDHIFEGDWDETTETGDSGWNFVFETRFTNSAFRNLVYNCDFTGLSSVWLAGNTDSVDRRWMVADSLVTNWRNYGFYVDRNYAGELSILGTTMARQHDALAGPFGIGKREIRNDHGPLRFANCRHAYFACCDFFNLAGWSGGGPNGLPAANATVRMFNYPVSQPQASIVDRCVAEGGYITWKMDGQDESAVEYPGNYLFDKVLTLCSTRTMFPWSTAMGGVTRRNCYTWAPNILYYDQSTYGLRHEVAYRQDGSNTPGSNTTHPMLNYSNTFLGLADDPTVPLTDGNDSAWGVNYVRENTIDHQPNANSPLTGFAPINTNPATEAVPGVTPRTSGVRWNYAPVTVSGVNVPSGGTLSIPYASLDRSNGAGDGDTTPTNQAYWQGLPASDNLHALKISGTELPFQAVRGELSVSYDDPTNIVITNTSGETWTGTAYIHLDRKSRLATDIPPLTQFASPANVPIPRPEANSAALGAADVGYVAYDDFMGTVRSSPKTAGAIEV